MRLQELRKASGLSLRKMSKLCGISNTVLSLLELGRRKPTIEHVTKLCDFFHVTSDYLLGKSELGLIVDFPRHDYFQVLTKYEYDQYLAEGSIQEIIEANQVWRLGSEELQDLFESLDLSKIKRELLTLIDKLDESQQLKLIKFIKEFIK